MNEERRCGTYIQWNITHPLKKNKIIAFVATWIDLEIFILSEVSQAKKSIIYNHTCVIFLKQLHK